MNYSRYSGALIVYKNYLYAIGGYTNTVERYDIIQKQWSIMANMKNQRGIVAALNGDKIYVVGEQCFGVYEPETDVWDSFPAPPVSHSTSLVSLRGTLFTFGGVLKDSREITDLIFEYDFVTQTWYEAGKMETPLKDHFAVVGIFSSTEIEN